MAKDIYDKIQIMSGVCKDNWKLLVIIFASLTGNILQATWTDNIKKVTESKPAQTITIKEKCKPQVCVCKCEIPIGKHVRKYHE